MTSTGFGKKHRGTHAVARRHDLIVCLPRLQDAPALGEAQQELPLRENLSLMAALLRENLVDHFHDLHRPVIAHRPITFLAVNDLLKEALPRGGHHACMACALPALRTRRAAFLLR